MSVNDPRIGARIGGYEIESFLGRGGMGVVYKARHLRLGRMVALKILAPELAADDNFRTRFVRESEIAASIDHPNVIPVYDADEVDGTLFLAMRYVDGTDLKKVIEEGGPLDAERTMSVITALGGALDAAHALGLIHRDIKPGNVLVGRTESGPEHIYLTDFGLTKHGSSKSGLTATGAFVGTIDYISPEQIEGKPVDARTDIYALGCVLFECLTGQVPFRKDEEVAVMYAHLMDERPKATTHDPSLPPAVDSVLAKAMARDPNARYAAGAELVSDLREALGYEAQPDRISAERPAPPARVDTTPGQAPTTRRPLPTKAIAIGAAALVLVAGGLFALTRDRGNSEPPASGSQQPAVPADAVYMAPDGSDTAAGTSEDPMSSLKAAVREAGEGGTVVLADGTYKADSVPMLTIKEPVTIMGAKGAAPVLQGNDHFADAIRIAAGTSSVTLSNLSFNNFNGEALKIFCFTCEETVENQDIALENLDFTSGGSPIIVENVTGLTLQGVDVHENDFTGFVCSPGPCNQVSIKDSTFESSFARFSEGVRVERGDELLIESSSVSTNSGNGLFSRATSTRVSGSRFQDNGGAGAYMTGPESQISDSIVAHNEEEGLILGPGSCQGCKGPGSITVANVLVAQNGAVGISPEADKDDDIVLQVFNTIFSGNDGTALRVVGPIAIDRLDHDLFDVPRKWIPVTWKGESYYGEDIENGDMPVENTSGTYGTSLAFVAPDDYHLEPGSPGVDEGTPDGVESDVDVEGSPRVQGAEIDIGPYEQ